jgi:hypothetical protein
MSMFNLAFILEKPAGPDKLRAVIDILVVAFPDVPSILETRVIPGRGGDGETVLIPLPISLSEQRQAKMRSTLDDGLARNGLRKKV